MLTAFKYNTTWWMDYGSDESDYYSNKNMKEVYRLLAQFERFLFTKCGLISAGSVAVQETLGKRNSNAFLSEVSVKLRVLHPERI